MWEKKSIVYHFENHIVTQRSSQHAYSLGALVRELILKMRITMQCNFWTRRSYKWRFLQCVENIFTSAKSFPLNSAYINIPRQILSPLPPGVKTIYLAFLK